MSSVILKNKTKALRFSWIALAFFLAGCVTEDILDGKRVALFKQNETNQTAQAIGQKSSFFLPPPVFISRWAQAAGSADHSSLNASLSWRFDRNATTQWRINIGRRTSSGYRLQVEPIIFDKKIFVIDPQYQLSAHDLSDGRRLWKNQLPVAKTETSTPVGGISYHAGLLYISTGYATLMAIDASSGELSWEANLPAPVRGSVTVFLNMLFATTIDNRTIAIDVKDGSLIWEHRAVISPTRLEVALAPAIAGNVVIATYGTGDVVALFRPTGRVLWQKNIAKIGTRTGFEEIDDVTNTPVIIGDYVLVSSFSGKLSALNLNDGRVLWDRNLVSAGGLTALGRYVFLIDHQKRLFALRLSDGATIWVKPLQRWRKKNRLDPVLWSAPLIAGGAILTWSSEKAFVAVSPEDGKEIWRQKWKYPVTTTPIAAENSLYILSKNGFLEAIR